MIHNFKFSNCFSFQEETELSFRIPNTVRESGLVRETPSGRFSTVMAVMGANGSGKTNFIKSLAFVHWFMTESFSWKTDAEIPFNPHFFSKNKESSIDVEFSAIGEVWRYHVSLTPKTVIREALYRKTSTRFSAVFVREQNRIVRKDKSFGFPDVDIRSNASVLSTAIQHDVLLVRKFARFPVFSNVGQGGRVHLSLDRLKTATNLFKKHGVIKKQMVELLRRWDLGLTDVIIKKIAVLNNESDTVKEIDMAFGVHHDGNKKAELMMSHESSGTQGAYALLSNILPALATGGLAVIDELEADLHPHMLKPIMDLFFSNQTNPKQAQLLCTCHSPEILNVLDKSQVVLVEKDKTCRSEAWRLDSVSGIRPADNYYAKYLSGAYGAVPWLH